MKRSPSSAFAHKGGEPRTQYGAICWRKSDDGFDVLLITSRETGRWVVPKGWPISGMMAADAAAKEAWEEAGVEGKICDVCLGLFSYSKNLTDGQSVPCVVAIYGLRVEKLSRRYPEQHQRRRKWFTATEAAELVAEPELRILLLALAQDAKNLGPDALAKKLKPPTLPAPQ
jgi:8-oxo-dGTP pyrophosphatase MutT (NUDIX family)